LYRPAAKSTPSFGSRASMMLWTKWIV
jgi:hypothetical protein